MVEILSSLSYKDRWVLVLTDPRRHFIINECKKRGIPYYYYSQKSSAIVDDIGINTLDQVRMVLLYNLIGCYFVSSKSEGGPKAIIESSFCKTLILSTDVVLAPDILDKRCIYNDIDTITKYLIQLIIGENQVYFKELITNNFKNVNAICSYEIMKERWKKVYEIL